VNVSVITMVLLEVRDLVLYYDTPRGPVHAVDGISFDLHEGKALGLVGESGSGKTSLGLALMRLLPKNVHTYAGSIELEGTPLMALSDEGFRRTIRWKKIAMAFQGAMNVLNPVLKIWLQVAEPLLAEGTSRRRARARVEELLELVGLPQDVADRYPHELSGGMKQRVVLAAALVLSPKVVILDEPTSALDVSIQAQIMNLLKRLKRELGLSYIFITHDIALASDLCDRLAIVYAGQITEVGTAEHVLLEPEHPYTQGLLASIPRLRSPQLPSFIPGAPPDPADLPPGCRFRPRCPYAFERCEEMPPLLQGKGPEHQARCWLLAGHRARK
jgi:oligopeptide/dipeptide ABC transporter ATP-binding protein